MSHEDLPARDSAWVEGLISAWAPDILAVYGADAVSEASANIRYALTKIIDRQPDIINILAGLNTTTDDEIARGELYLDTEYTPDYPRPVLANDKERTTWGPIYRRTRIL